MKAPCNADCWRKIGKRSIFDTNTKLIRLRFYWQWHWWLFWIQIWSQRKFTLFEGYQWQNFGEFRSAQDFQKWLQSINFLISCSSQNSSNVGVDVALKRRLLSLLVVVVLLSLGRTFDLQRVDGADGVAALGRRDPATRALRRVLAQTDAVVHFAGAADVDVVSVANDVIAVRLPGFRRQLASRDEEEQRGCHEDVPNAEKRQTSSYMKNEHSK